MATCLLPASDCARAQRVCWDTGKGHLGDVCGLPRWRIHLTVRPRRTLTRCVRWRSSRTRVPFFNTTLFKYTTLQCRHRHSPWANETHRHGRCRYLRSQCLRTCSVWYLQCRCKWPLAVWLSFTFLSSTTRHRFRHSWHTLWSLLWVVSHPLVHHLITSG